MKTERHQQYANILITGVEDGIWHWAQVYKYETGEETNTTPKVTLRDQWGDEPRKELCIVNIAAAFNMLKSGKASSGKGVDYWKRAYKEVGTGDWDYDAEDADILIQVAMYGEIVYG